MCLNRFFLAFRLILIVLSISTLSACKFNSETSEGSKIISKEDSLYVMNELRYAIYDNDRYSNWAQKEFDLIVEDFDFEIKRIPNDTIGDLIFFPLSCMYIIGRYQDYFYLVKNTTDNRFHIISNKTKEGMNWNLNRFNEFLATSNFDNLEAKQLIKIYELTQIQPLHHTSGSGSGLTPTCSYLFELKNINEIINEADYYSFADLIRDTFKLTPPVKLEYKDSISFTHNYNQEEMNSLKNSIKSEMDYYYDSTLCADKKNKKYLMNILPEIRASVQSDSIFFIYTIPDLKVFKIKFYKEGGVLQILSEYINPFYSWGNFYYSRSCSYIKTYRYYYGDTIHRDNYLYKYRDYIVE